LGEAKEEQMTLIDQFETLSDMTKQQLASLVTEKSSIAEYENETL